MKKITNFLKNIFATIANCIIPVLPAMIGVGMIRLLLIILSPTALNLLSTDSSTYIVLTFVADSCYYFLPVLVAISSAEVFKTNKYVAGVLGAMLLSPTYVEYVTSGISLSVFNLPIAMTSYDSQIISPIMIVWLFSYIYNFLDSHVNEKIKGVFVSFLSILVMVPVAFCLVGPIGVWLGNILVNFTSKLLNIGPIGGAIYCAIIPFICILGLGGVNLTIIISMMAQGPDQIAFFSNVCYNVILGVVVLVYYFKSKDNEAIATSITSAIAGISEPAIFGVIVKNTYLLIPLCTSCFVAGFLNILFNIYSYTLASFGIFGIIATIGDKTPFINSVIVLLIGIIMAFVTTEITLKKRHE